MDARPIGIFDSGMGGVSLLRDARMLLPTENFIYYGDNLNAPYGDRTEEEILALTENSADFLLQLGVKALVIACNTATSASINVLRKRLDVPVISVEPAIKPACEIPGTAKSSCLPPPQQRGLQGIGRFRSECPTRSAC